MSSRFEMQTVSIDGLIVLRRCPLGDERGFLERVFCDSDLEDVLNGATIRQINRTLTREQGTIRGLHFQHPPHAETKFISCLRGRVFDVAVDLRQDSPTFLSWHAEILSESNDKTFVIPAGFAHGFQTLSIDCELLYLHTAAHSPTSEDGINAMDEQLAIPWPTDVGKQSGRDLALPHLNASFRGVRP